MLVPLRGLMLHGYTYSGPPSRRQPALTSLKIVEDENLPKSARLVGDHLLAGLNLRRRSSHVGDVRGKRLMAAIELVSDCDTKAPLAPNSTFGAPSAAW